MTGAMSCIAGCVVGQRHAIGGSVRPIASQKKGAKARCAGPSRDLAASVAVRRPSHVVSRLVNSQNVG
jgi:hypothetical protein